MTVLTSKTFKSGNSQAVRLPKEVAFPDDTEVTIERSGDVVTIRPKRLPMAELVARLKAMPSPPEIEERDADFWPDRPGLCSSVFLLDTNIVIHMRDGNEEVLDAVAELRGEVALSILTRIELEGGVYSQPVLTPIRRQRLDEILTLLPVLNFDAAAADAYRRIVEAAGFSRRKITDRMIGAHAVSRNATLVTMNGADFADIADLKLLVW